MDMKSPAAFIYQSRKTGVIRFGCSSNLYEDFKYYNAGINPGDRNTYSLIYYEIASSYPEAQLRLQQLCSFSDRHIQALISSINPYKRDLSKEPNSYNEDRSENHSESKGEHSSFSATIDAYKKLIY